MAVDGCSRHSRGSATCHSAENLQPHRTFWYLCAVRLGHLDSGFGRESEAISSQPIKPCSDLPCPDALHRPRSAVVYRLEPMPKESYALA